MAVPGSFLSKGTRARFATTRGNTEATDRSFCMGNTPPGNCGIPTLKLLKLSRRLIEWKFDMYQSGGLSATVALFIVLCGLASTSGIKGQESDEDGVCYTGLWKVRCVLEKVPCDCWESTWISKQDCKVAKSKARGKKRTPGNGWWTDDGYYEDYGRYCYKHTLTVCYNQIERCYEYREQMKYCCHGYEEDGNGGCMMTDQCRTNNGGCEQMCISGVDGPDCKCMQGYHLVENKRCDDVDECAEPERSDCQHNCNNTDGSYLCTCPPGYDMISDTDCEERNECLYGNGGCQQMCVNTNGSFYCLCRDGFHLMHDNECHDVDECTDSDGGCSHICVNDFGTYSCLCPDGLVLNSDNRTCTSGDDQTKRPPIEAEQNGGDDSLSGGTIAGITVGVLIGLACLVALFCLLARRFGFHKAAANAAPLAVVTPHVYSEPSVSVLPVSLPPKKPVVDDGVYMTVDNEDGGHTNIAFSNELYGNTCGDDAIIPSKQELDESEVNPDHSDPVYSNTQGAQATLMEAEPVYGNVDMSSGKAKPVPLPRSGPPPQTYENLANASNIRGDGER